jgi:hypothetical protein
MRPEAPGFTTYEGVPPTDQVVRAEAPVPLVDTSMMFACAGRSTSSASLNSTFRLTVPSVYLLPFSSRTSRMMSVLYNLRIIVS